MKFAICQELYENTDWATQCRLIAEAGYTGIEVAPFTISTDLASVPVSVFSEMKTLSESQHTNFTFQLFALNVVAIITLRQFITSISCFHLDTNDDDVTTICVCYN